MVLEDFLPKKSYERSFIKDYYKTAGIILLAGGLFLGPLAYVQYKDSKEKQTQREMREKHEKTKSNPATIDSRINLETEK